jgi:hypothetical protein
MDTSFFKVVWLRIVTNSLWIKPTYALNTSFIGITTLHVSGSLSAHHRDFLAVHRYWYILCRFDYRFLSGAPPGSKRSSNLHKIYQYRCTAKNSWWWAERLPETCRVVIPIKLEFSAAVGFIHKEYVTMYGQTILKYLNFVSGSFTMDTATNEYMKKIQNSKVCNSAIPA